MKIIRHIINAIFILLFIFVAVLYVPNKVNRYDENSNFIKFVGVSYYPIWYNIPQKPVNILHQKIVHSNLTDDYKKAIQDAVFMNTDGHYRELTPYDQYDIILCDITMVCNKI